MTILLGRRVRRWWRGKGHGVHSPFAFRFIRCVLRENGAYYASSELARMDNSKWLGVLFRLVCEFEPDEVISTGLTAGERCAVEMADSRTVIVSSGERDRIVMKCRGLSVTVVRDVLSSRAHWEDMKSGMRCGMTFTNGRVGIVVPRADLPRQDFEINF
ncbi:hypothetical protein [Duncaniella freteri]|uniref:hypothetical protein n=1 Tax=Duncaniella freteri TaxID=2530391 RepID=UPI00255839BF|nr:hypothetical protein [Duncaniella freteri]